MMRSKVWKDTTPAILTAVRDHFATLGEELSESEVAAAVKHVGSAFGFKPKE